MEATTGVGPGTWLQLSSDYTLVITEARASQLRCTRCRGGGSVTSTKRDSV